MLSVIGYVDNWYSYSTNEANGTIDTVVDISVFDHELYSVKENMLKRMKNRAVDYYEFMGANRESIAKTSRATTVQEIIGIFVDWYYSKYLYHHKEMFLDFLEFIDNNTDNNSEKITDEIKDYFTLPFIEIKSDESRYTNLSLRELANKVAQGFGRNTLVNIERINSNRYSLNLDFFLLFGGLRIQSRFDENRMERILENISTKDFVDVIYAIGKVYPHCSTETRFALMKFFEARVGRYGISFTDFCNSIYQQNERDILFYGILAMQINKRFYDAARGEMLCYQR